VSLFCQRGADGEIGNGTVGVVCTFNAGGNEERVVSLVMCVTVRSFKAPCDVRVFPAAFNAVDHSRTLHAWPAIPETADGLPPGDVYFLMLVAPKLVLTA